MPDPVAAYDLGDGRTLHRWTDRGEAWACMAYDHGPMCRLCQPVDDTLTACLDLVVDGALVARMNAEGGFEFHLTETGMAQAAHLIRQLAEGEDANDE